MKRNIKHSTLLLMTWAMMGLTTSCDSYLDVQPSTEKEKTEMLSPPTAIAPCSPAPISA
jgi:hypothetical protein